MESASKRKKLNPDEPLENASVFIAFQPKVDTIAKYVAGKENTSDYAKLLTKFRFFTTRHQENDCLKKKAKPLKNFRFFFASLNRLLKI